MKIILILSLLLNAAFVAGAILLLPGAPTGPAPEHVAGVGSVSAESADRLPKEPTMPADEETRPPARPDLSGMDSEEEVAALVAAGWSQEDAKVFALGRVLREFMEFTISVRGKEGEEYWTAMRAPNMEWEDQRKMMEMQRRMQSAMENLIGRSLPGMFGTADAPLPPEKLRAAQIVQQDYQMMQMKLHADAGGIMLPEDHQALALLDEERRRDMEAILARDELFEYEVRNSSTAQNLRNRLAGMEPTEEEFREIFRLQSEVERTGGQRPGADEETRQRAAEAGEKMKEGLQEVLGKERFRLWERNQDWSYTQLVNVAKRLDLPRERVDQVYDVKEYTENRQRELQNEGDLSQEERQAALQTLGQETREDLKELMGERGFELYQQNGGHWLQQLPQ